MPLALQQHFFGNILKLRVGLDLVSRPLSQILLLQNETDTVLSAIMDEYCDILRKISLYRLASATSIGLARAGVAGGER